MRNVLHLLTEPPDALTQSLIECQRSLAATRDLEIHVADLSAPDADYDRILDRIFAAESVSVW